MQDDRDDTVDGLLGKLRVEFVHDVSECLTSFAVAIRCLKTDRVAIVILDRYPGLDPRI